VDYKAITALAKLIAQNSARIYAVESAVIEILATSESDLGAMHERQSTRLRESLPDPELQEQYEISRSHLETASDNLFALAAALRQQRRDGSPPLREQSAD
jgi:hypothetical protein